ncbi:hypothetical protein M885DRAFT_625720 [Pelagophyceae sp. CCMP2097]|nr:hypothetical protein M885DRAFT_625720 [Pelagophyceae sp. CCMP2097]|mmetsp:Transcript_14669/g.50979  ORF Transcript_14669/g.50979 Transcript_14669/m.50979 type:complete len:280 (+) Transcript_14669:80-919(+)
MSTRLRLIRGDIAKQSAAAIVTSANDALVGNAQPLYWRFASRKNVDGAVRAAAGPRLAAVCLDFPALTDAAAAGGADAPARDISRWEATAKHGSSWTLRCAPGDAVVTGAFALDADHVIHAVAPDSEFGYEGPFQGLPGERGVDVRPWSNPPLQRLEAAYATVLARAAECGAASVACPSLGAGVKGWKPAISAAIGLSAVAASSTRPAHFDVVLGSDDAWVAWKRVAEQLLGPPQDDWTWDLPPGVFLLDVGALPELLPRPPAKAGWAGEGWRPTSNSW